MSKTFFNTTNESENQVKMFSEKNKGQNQIVLSIANELKTFSASEIFKKYPTASVPITSIRRAINTLKEKGKIRATGNKVKGMYGANELQYTTV